MVWREESAGSGEESREDERRRSESAAKQQADISTRGGMYGVDAHMRSIIDGHRCVARTNSDVISPTRRSRCARGEKAANGKSWIARRISSGLYDFSVMPCKPESPSTRAKIEVK